MRKSPVKSVAQRTRSKATPCAAKASCSVQSVSSESLDSPRVEKSIEVSSDRVYAKGIHHLLSLVTYVILSLFLTTVLLTFLEPFYVIVEFKPPVIKPLIISSRELFAKRAREDKASDTESSKSPPLFNLELSPDAKRFKPSPSVVLTKPESSFPAIFRDYDAGTKPSDFAHMLEDLLLGQYVEESSRKGPSFPFEETVGHAFHVRLSFVMILLLSEFVVSFHHLLYFFRCRLYRHP